MYRLVPPPPPTSGYRPEFLDVVSYYELRHTSLAESMPAEKYSWRLAERTLSVGELIASVAGGNVLNKRTLEGPLKPGVGYAVSSENVVRNAMAQANDKNKVLQRLRDLSSTTLCSSASLSFKRRTSRRIKDTTIRGSFLLIATNWGQQLGQLIAYARMNGIALPSVDDSQLTT